MDSDISGLYHELKSSSETWTEDDDDDDDDGDNCCGSRVFDMFWVVCTDTSSYRENISLFESTHCSAGWPSSNCCFSFAIFVRRVWVVGKSLIFFSDLTLDVAMSLSRHGLFSTRWSYKMSTVLDVQHSTTPANKHPVSGHNTCSIWICWFEMRIS